MKNLPHVHFYLCACLFLGRIATGADVLPLPLAKDVVISGIAMDRDAVPAALKLHEPLGIIGAAAIDGQVVHRTTTRVLETRAVQTPCGDYLLFFAEGEHYANGKGRRKVNSVLAYRSSDHGKTWQGPSVPFDIDYSQHGVVPLVPRGSRRIYAFGTQPNPDEGYSWQHGQQENAPIGFRWSDDDGRTWSKTQIIRPGNDPGFMGMSVMRMCETDAGTWLLGSHVADWSVRPIKTQQYLLRSEDQGETWTLLPDKRPGGRSVAGFDRMDEARPIDLGGGKVLAMSRTPAGSLFVARSTDDGKRWSRFKPTPLVHPDAPPMLFHLCDGRTLIALHHNRRARRSDDKLANGSLSDKAENMKVRSEIWFSTSADEGETWREPRFLFATAAEPNLPVAAWNYQCSYVDMFVDAGILHLFVPHRWQQVLHLAIPEVALAALPTKAQLAAATAIKKPAAAVQNMTKSAVSAPKKSAAASADKKAPNYVSQLSTKIEPARRVVYKEIADRQLHLDIFEPTGLKPGDRRPCFFSIHGGGWTSGSPRNMYWFAAHCAERGMVAISVEYRLYKPGSDITVFECVKDVRSAMRYVRAHAADLAVDPEKIVVNGASAGGHLAVATALLDGVDEPGEDIHMSCAPSALMLFSPVIDTSTEGYGDAKKF